VEFIDLVILFFNLVIFGLAVMKVGQLYKIHQTNLTVQKQIEDLIHENTRMSDMMFDELDTKLVKGERLIRQLDLRLEEAETARAAVSRPAPRGTVFHLPVTPAPAAAPDPIPLRQRDEPLSVRSHLNPDGPQVVEWMNEGLSVLEISKRLNMTQGEVILKLNLEKKRAF
jgi:hypothetical protein